MSLNCLRKWFWVESKSEMWGYLRSFLGFTYIRINWIHKFVQQAMENTRTDFFENYIFSITQTSCKLNVFLFFFLLFFNLKLPFFNIFQKLCLLLIHKYMLNKLFEYYYSVTFPCIAKKLLNKCLFRLFCYGVSVTP